MILNNGITMKLSEQFSTEDYRGKHILVTGSSGYLANNLINFLKDVECKITRVSRTGAILSLIDGKCKITDIITDIEDERTWQQILPDVDIIMHFAAQTNTAEADANPIEDRNHNVLPLLTLLECCRKYGHKPLVLLASTVSIYGLPETLPVDESFPDQPLSMYEIHKLQCEQYLDYYIYHGYIKGAALRLANVYGPGVKTTKANRGIINVMVKKAISGDPLTIYDNGEFYRDYVYVDDVSRAFLVAGLQSDTVNGKRFIIANGNAYNLNQAAELIAADVGKRTNKSIAIEHIEMPASASILDSRNFHGDISAFSQATGWKPEVDLEEGIKLTIDAMI